MRCFGAEVMVVECPVRPVAHEDDDVSDAVSVSSLMSKVYACGLRPGACGSGRRANAAMSSLTSSCNSRFAAVAALRQGTTYSRWLA